MIDAYDPTEGLTGPGDPAFGNRVRSTRSRLGRRLDAIRNRSQSGAALVEFSLVFGLFVFILYGLIAFGMMFALKQSITNAASEGARSVVGVVDDPNTPLDERVEKAKSTVAQRLDWLGSRYEPGSDLAASIEPCAGAVSSQCVRVRITYPYENRPLVPPAPGLGLVTPNSFKSEAVVQISS